MIKRKPIQMTFTFISFFLFTACGGSSSNQESKTDEISKRDYVLINYHYPEDVCNSSGLKSLLQSIQAKDIVVLVTSQYVSCENYGKANDGRSCAIQDLNYANEPTCVVGLNHSSNNVYKSKKTNQTLFMENIQNSIISEF